MLKILTSFFFMLSISVYAQIITPQEKTVLDIYYLSTTGTISGSQILNNTISLGKLTNDVQTSIINGSNAWVWISTNIYTQGTNATKRITHTSSPYSLTFLDHVLFCDTDGGSITSQLPAGITGKPYKFINCGTNSLYIVGSGVQKIFNASTQILHYGEVLSLHYETTEGWW